MNIAELYLSGKSIPQVSCITGLHRSTVRYRLFKLGILRTRREGVLMASRDGRLASRSKGKRRVFTQEWKDNISKGKRGKGKGWSLKPSGYIEITMGENKGRPQHVVIMEEHIGRRLYSNECVHHVDGVRHNNSLSNLMLMTRKEHASLHASENIKNRHRNKKGQFK
jgi:hypothetical protein